MKSSQTISSVPFESDSSSRDPFAKHFIPRPGSRRKGLAVEFDPQKHRDWVTGFQKRRSERKTAARKSLETKVKRERLEERRKKFERRKQELNLPNDYGVDDETAGKLPRKDMVADSKQYTFDGSDSVVTTMAIAMHSSSSESEAEESDHEPLAVLAHPTQMRRLSGDEKGSHLQEPVRNESAKAQRRGTAPFSAAQRLNKLKQGKNMKRGKGCTPKGGCKSSASRRGKKRKGPKR